MTTWRDDFIVVNQYTRPGKKLTEVRKLIVHYTANPGASAANHKRYFGETLIAQNRVLPEEARRYASAHIFIDKLEAICIIPLDELAYAANDNQRYVNGKPYRGVPELLPNANYLSVSVELCIESDGTFHADTIKRAEDVFAELCKKFNLDPLKDIVTHEMVTDKQCPRPWLGANDHLFQEFKQRVNDKLNPPKVVVKVEEGDEEILKPSKSFYDIILAELQDVTDESKYGKQALNKVWLERFMNNELTVSDAIGILFTIRRRGL